MACSRACVCVGGGGDKEDWGRGGGTLILFGLHAFEI